MSTPANGQSANQKQIYMTLTGLPLTFELKWPFHKSTSGADFWVLHADIRLANTEALHAPVAVNLSATVREVMPSLEPKDAEAPVLAALRKEVDRAQLEFLKSGKLVPVHFSSRHYDFKRNKWIFGHATDEVITTFLERKIYWQTKLLGGDVWIGSEPDAMYLETTTDHLAQLAANLAKSGLITMERRYANANQSLMAQSERYEAAASSALKELEKKHEFERG
ncbi:MAG TPA: hypothetical protein VFA89_17140 [Terriglobales bacterium]|nr:hypothetical protein [Terriglobales bacterium]